MRDKSLHICKPIDHTELGLQPLFTGVIKLQRDKTLGSCSCSCRSCILVLQDLPSSDSAVYGQDRLDRYNYPTVIVTCVRFAVRRSRYTCVGLSKKINADFGIYFKLKITMMTNRLHCDQLFLGNSKNRVDQLL